MAVTPGGPVSSPRPPQPQDVHAVLAAGSGLSTVLQPVVDLRLASIAGYEALTRFDGSAAPPDQWFAVAHTAGMGPELEALALATAFRRRADLSGTEFLAVNVSPHLLDSPAVRAALEDAAPLDGIVVELTEHVDPGEREPLLDALLRLRALGARIALDDMGTGYSGLREIATLQPDLVKLDRSFVDHCDRDPVKAAVVESLCAISNRLHAILLAEGVERVEELDWLQLAGVPMAQGWLLGRPEPLPRPVPAKMVGRLRARADLMAPANGATAGVVMYAAPVLPAHVLPRSDPTAASAAVLVTEPAAGPRMAQLHVAVDAWHRPQSLVTWDGAGVPGPPRPITLSARVGTRLLDLARQIPVRPAEHRYDPVVCTDVDGTYLGVVEVDRILTVLADQVDARPEESVPPARSVPAVPAVD